MGRSSDRDLAAALTRQGRVVEVIVSNLVGLSLPLVQEGLTFTLAASDGRLALLDGAQRAGQDDLEVARAMVQPFLAAPDAPQEPHDRTEPGRAADQQCPRSPKGAPGEVTAARGMCVSRWGSGAGAWPGPGARAR